MSLQWQVTKRAVRFTLVGSRPIGFRTGASPLNCGAINRGAINRSAITVCVLLLASFTLIAPVVAQSSVQETDIADEPGSTTAGSTTGTSKLIEARSAVGADVSVDGVLTEEIWANATWTSDFSQSEPVEGAEPSERTEIAIVYDSDALYVAARMYTRDPSTIRAIETRHDNETNADRVAISLDTYDNRRTAYTFVVTASGVRLDYYHQSDREYRADYSFDPVWEADARVDGSGWTAEMRIPFSQLRFTVAGDQEWGINISRRIPSRNERIYWIYTPRNETGWASRFGRLTGIANVQPSRRLEVLPYVASGGVLTGEEIDSANPFARKFDSQVRAGVDVKMGLGPNLTLDATINPDFGQVEADPAEVNLSAFETFNRERRPFFSEGGDILNGSAFYSRRIGASPRGSVDAEYADRPRNTTILAAAKVSGRLASGFTLAALASATQSEYARTFDPESSTRDRTRVEPFAAYLAVAGQQELGSNASNIGFKFTGVQRMLKDHELLAERLNTSGFTGEGNGRWRSAEGAYTIDMSARLTRVNGSTARIRRLQETSVHYFQRPDADYLSVDTTATSLTGHGVDFFASKNTGRFRANTFLLAESPHYDPNDLGRLGRADELSARGQVQWRSAEPSEWYQNYRFETSAKAEWNYGLLFNAVSFDHEFDIEWKNFWETTLSFGHGPESTSDFATRGGPRMKLPASREANIEFGSNDSKQLSFGSEFSIEWDDLEGRAYAFETGLVWQPGESMEIVFSPAYEESRGGRQYVGRRDGGSEATFGSRYIFSQIDQSELSAQLRLNYTFTPKLTLELYAEPFAASGTFYRFGELAEAGGIDLREYGTDGTLIAGTDDGYVVTDGADTFELSNRNFNVRSFRSNVVLRWEWRPGSTMFLVWQQDREAELRRGGLVRPGSLIDSVADVGDNFFGFKLSYWLPVG